jgi:hypothetical protein
MRPRLGICRGCTRVFDASTLNDRKRCPKCAKKVETRECHRCGDDSPRDQFIGTECLPCRSGIVPAEPAEESKDDATWETSDGWRRLLCLGCRKRFWSIGKSFRFCFDCRETVLSGNPFEFSGKGHPTRCLGCGINILDDMLCISCESEGRRHPDRRDEEDDDTDTDLQEEVQ